MTAFEMPAGETHGAALREVTRKMQQPGAKIVMGPHKIVRECDDSNLRMETQDVEIWTPTGEKAVARFTTYRCRATGKPVIAHVDAVEEP